MIATVSNLSAVWENCPSKYMCSQWGQRDRVPRLQYYKPGICFVLPCVIQMSRALLCLCQLFLLAGAVLLPAFPAPAEGERTVLLPSSSQWIYSFSLEEC